MHAAQNERTIVAHGSYIYPCVCSLCTCARTLLYSQPIAHTCFILNSLWTHARFIGMVNSTLSQCSLHGARCLSVNRHTKSIKPERSPMGNVPSGIMSFPNMYADSDRPKNTAGYCSHLSCVSNRYTSLKDI